MEYSFKPVAYIRNDCREFYQVPYQVGILPEMTSVVEFENGCNYEAALKDLEGFQRIWIVFVFDKANTWKPLIQPPRGNKKVGVFACRSPHRPNPVGISAVELLKVEGRKLWIKNHDLLDGTPILDIKPYIPEVDSYENSEMGWLSEVEATVPYELQPSEKVRERLQFLKDSCGYDLLGLAEVNLRTSPLPRPNNRIKQQSDGSYKMAMKTWRLIYQITDRKLFLNEVKSGYDQETLSGEKKSRWDDVWMHQKFLEEFGE
ncbi:MAG: tRNA (N6-threonylcarbamoyladenosine(37)-N6)-methyltransferase TrmO [Lentisphaerales bacterium]|nr:tRNA (N6-threonylcarbamoyladenosine(37)-N6)-methyltransferase TrmO [Lentisphaerales bacterium]